MSGSDAMWIGTLTEGGWEDIFYHNLAEGMTTQVTNNTIHEGYGDSPVKASLSCEYGLFSPTNGTLS